VPDIFRTKPKSVIGKGGRIVVNNVDPGVMVSLYLNSDAHPAYRQNPVYPIAPADRDVVVTIKEKPGKYSNTDIPVRKVDRVAAEAGADNYQAALTGDVWMKVSHKYSAGEIPALLPSDTAPHIVSAIKKIYEGLAGPSLTIVAPPDAGDPNKRTLSISFIDGQNPRANVNSGYDLLNEGLQRVHPAGYAAVFGAGLVSGVDKIVMSSCWRPMLGSIAHRAGLGLDVAIVDATPMDRAELRIAKGPDTTNVSEEEKKLFAAFEAAKAQQLAAKKALNAADAEAANARGAPDRLLAAKQKLREKSEASDAATKARKVAEQAWNGERNKNEPQHVRAFRTALVKSESIVQVFDPWFMDFNTHDKVDGTPNLQSNDNESGHADHLHITVYEPKIL
jgi:hypothetical protein